MGYEHVDQGNVGVRDLHYQADDTPYPETFARTDMAGTGIDWGGDMEDRGRNAWVFSYSLEDLHAAAKAKVDHHKDRLLYWKKEQTARGETLRTRGIDVTTIIARGAQSSAPYYGQPTLDVELTRKYAEAQERVTHHHVLLATFERWLRVFEHQRVHGHPAQVRGMTLTIEDVEFFGL